MSAPVPSPAPAPYQQWQTFFPPAVSSYEDILSSMQNQHINQNIYNSTDKLISGINETSQYLTAGLNNIGKEVTQSSLGLRDAVERGNLINGNSIERTTGDIKLNTVITDAANRQAAADIARDILRAVDQNGNANGNAIERTTGELKFNNVITDAANRQAASDIARDIIRSVDKNGNTTERVGSALSSAVERNGGSVMTAIERVAGEGRMTTTVTDAASRQAANDLARDILGTVERTAAINTSAIKDSGSTLLSTAERNAGELRANFLNAQNVTSQLLTDVRHSVLNDINCSTNELLTAGTQSYNDLGKEVSNGNWETRNTLNASFLENMKAVNQVQLQSSQNFATTMLEQQRSTALLNTEGAARYASTVLEGQKSTALLSLEAQRNAAILSLEGQKSTALLSLDGANQYSSLMMEQQKVKEYLSSKGDSHFAMNQLEMQKVKEGLASQAAHNFASLQLDAHKIKESIQAQLADAKYDALKNTQFLADKMCECCCEVKQKIDLVDRDRLRDGLVVERTDNQFLKAAEFFDRRGNHGRGDYGHHDHYHHGHHGHGDDHRGHDDHRR